MNEANNRGTCTRRVAIKTFAAIAGGAVAGATFSKAWSALPWAEESNSLLLGEMDYPVKLGEGQAYKPTSRQAAPALALDRESGQLWTTWTAVSDEAEDVHLRSFSTKDQSWGPVIKVSAGDGNCGDSNVVVMGQRMIVVWSQYSGGRWQLLSRSFDRDGNPVGPANVVAGESESRQLHWQPMLACDGKQLLVVWQSKESAEAPFAVMARKLDGVGKPIGDVVNVTRAEKVDCCRPTVAVSPKGDRFAIAFDRQDAPGTQNVYLALMDASTGKVSKPVAASNHPASDVSPSVAFSPDGELVWVAWHSNRKDEAGWRIPRWYRLAALRLSDMSWHEPVASPAGKDLEARATVQGFEMTRLYVTPRGGVCVTGRPSQGFYVQSYSGGEVSPLYRLPKDGWGGRGRLLNGVFDEDGAFWCTRRDLQMNVLHRIEGLNDGAGMPALKPYAEPAATAVALQGVTAVYSWPEPAKPRRGKKPAKQKEDLNVYFGDIHGHSWQSDGMGDPEDSFVRARDVLRDDFHVLTDHDNFVGQRVQDAQWQAQKDMVEHYHQPHKFVPIFGQEWTTPRTNRPHGWGHFNIYTADPTIPLIDHKESRYRDLSDLYAMLRKHNAIAIPHHIGWTGVPWQEMDTELVPVVEVCSVHGAYEHEGNEPIRHRGGMSGNFYVDGLNRGLRIGAVGGSDQHGLIWQHGVCWKENVYRAGLTGVWAPELTRESVLDAFRARRTFATSGVKLCPRFAVNDATIGDEIETAEAPEVSFDVSVPPQEGRLTWIQVIRNGEIINNYGGEAQQSRFAFTDHDCPVGKTSYYYLRVSLNTGDMAWTSPIWVSRA